MKVDWSNHKEDWVILIKHSVSFLKITEVGTLHHKNAKRALDRLLRAWTDYSPKYVSRGAMILFESKSKSPVDLLRKDSRLLNNKADNLKPLIVFEHTTPISEFISYLCTKESNQIENSLLNYSGVCWITREEDNELNKNKFRNNRNGNWEAAYKKCNIELIKL